MLTPPKGMRRNTPTTRAIPTASAREHALDDRHPDAGRGGYQSAVTTSYTYEPIYNQVRTTVDPRGNDPSYVPQNGGAQSAARYTTT